MTRRGDVTGWRKYAGIVTFVTAPGLVLGGLFWAGSLPIRQAAARAQAQCLPVVVAAPKPASFVVNVVNHDAQPGTASRVAKELTLRKFHTGKVFNDVALKRVNGVGEIRYGTQGLDAALLVQKTILPAAELTPDFRDGTSVDLVVTPEFVEMAPAVEALVHRSDVVVNVYNTTYFEGLARKASGTLTQLGFRAGKVGLDPKKSWVTDVAVVRYGPDGERGAKLVYDVVPGARMVKDSSMKGTKVDLLIGMDWTGVTSPYLLVPQASKKAATPVTVARPCS